MKPQFTTFKGNLKFTRQSMADQYGKDAMNFVAPGFSADTKLDLEDSEETKSENEYRRIYLKVAKEMGFQTSETNLEPKKRRFAGDYTLSRGAYFGVCLQGSQWDANVLATEINAYRVPELNGFTLCGDLNDQVVADNSNNGVRENALGFLIENAALFLKKYPQHKDLVKKQKSIVVKYPYAVEYREILNVIDLRLPQTQEWFYEKFKTGDGIYFQKPNGTNIDSFYDMLPALMHLKTGGNYETQGIGIWMRHNSVNALVFPSARSDTYASINNGSLEESSGWNLVDYAITKEKPEIGTFLDDSPWFDKIFNGVQYVIAQNDPYKGSFKITGNEDLQLKIFDTRMEKIELNP